MSRRTGSAVDYWVKLKMKRQLLLNEKVILAQDYRSFLKESIDILRQKKKGFSLTTFARTAGFGSRGFILDVIRGNKRLTARSVPKAIKGLGLNGKLKSLFLALVDQSERDVSVQKSDPKDVAKKIERLRTELLGEMRQASDTNSVKPSSIYSDINRLVVYSALGSPETGATLGQICTRTSLTENAVVPLLKQMSAENLVSADSQHYKAINSHLVFERLGGDPGFQSIFLDSLKLVRDSAAKTMNRNDGLFFHSVVPVDKARLTELKASLRAVITDFIHENQMDEGDHIAMLQLAFF